MSALPMDLMPYEEPRARMVMPVVTPDEARAAIAAYEAMKTAIIRPGDEIVTGNGKFLKKSYWMRAARCFGLRVENVREERLELDGGRVAYRVINRAIAPDGQSMDGDGFFMEGEKKEANEHNIRARAFTRATNRAISNLIGGGEVSAEELPDDHETRRPPVRGMRPMPPQARVVESTPQRKPVAELISALHASCVKNQFVTTQDEWDQELATCLGPSYDGHESKLTHGDFDALKDHFAAMAHSLRNLPVPEVRP